MKKLIAAICALALLVQAACASHVNPSNRPKPTMEPTAEPTAVLTADPMEDPNAGPSEYPTEYLTADPSEYPTEYPTAPAISDPIAPPTPALVFPTPGRMGNLVGGPLFDEPAAYFVLDGESDLKYVFNRFGELVTVFNAADYEEANWSGSPAFYGAHGMPYGYSIERGEWMPPYCFFDNMAIQISYSKYLNENGEESHSFFITDIKDDRLEKTILMDNAPEFVFVDDEGNTRTQRAFEIGWMGGILHVNGVYLVYKATMENFGEQDQAFVYNECLMLDESGNLIGEIDLSAFSRVRGIFGGKYIIEERYLDESERYEDSYGYMIYSETNLYTLSGELVMRRVTPYPTSHFAVDDELGFGSIYTARFLKDEHGIFYDKDLNPIPEPDEDELRRDPERFAGNYFALRVKDRQIVSGSGVYAGIKDAAGNWLFKIYNPAGASDSQNEEHWPSWYWDYYFRENYGD